MKPCAAVILAAGAASRWKHGPKALAPWRGATLIDHACEVARAAGCAPVYRVLGAHREAVEAAAPAPAGVVTIFNPDWADGIGASLACAARALLGSPAADECAGLLVSPCDQPLISPELLRALRAEHERGGRGLVFSRHDSGQPVPPAFFARRHWPELATLTGDTGARRLALAHPHDCAFVPAPLAGEDIDTPEDHARLLAMHG